MGREAPTEVALMVARQVTWRQSARAKLGTRARGESESWKPRNAARSEHLRERTFEQLSATRFPNAESGCSVASRVPRPPTLRIRLGRVPSFARGRFAASDLAPDHEWALHGPRRCPSALGAEVEMEQVPDSWLRWPPRLCAPFHLGALASSRGRSLSKSRARFAANVQRSAAVQQLRPARNRILNTRQHPAALADTGALAPSASSGKTAQRQCRVNWLPATSATALQLGN